MKIFILAMLVTACGTEPSKSDKPAPKPKASDVAPTSDLDPLPADWSPCHPQPKCPDAPLPEPTLEAPKAVPVVVDDKPWKDPRNGFLWTVWVDDDRRWISAGWGDCPPTWHLAQVTELQTAIRHGIFDADFPKIPATEFLTATTGANLTRDGKVFTGPAAPSQSFCTDTP